LQRQLAENEQLICFVRVADRILANAKTGWEPTQERPKPTEVTIAPGLPVHDVIGRDYAAQRRADPRIAAGIGSALADARSVLNVGAGAGSYEPRDREVVALEPSPVMLAQRPPGSAAAVQGRAESLPFSDLAFDAVLGVLTLHHWSDRLQGLRECARVARDRVVLLTCDPAAVGFWLTQRYLPEFIALDREQFFPSLDVLTSVFGPQASIAIVPVPIPRDCVDGFLGAFWARPHAYLDPRVRSGISSFAYRDAEPGLARLRSDLADGSWGARFGHLLALEALDIGYRLVIAQLPARRAA
jgi:SAM-dependent methyltransferase